MNIGFLIVKCKNTYIYGGGGVRVYFFIYLKINFSGGGSNLDTHRRLRLLVIHPGSQYKEKERERASHAAHTHGALSNTGSPLYDAMLARSAQRSLFFSRWLSLQQVEPCTNFSILEEAACIQKPFAVVPYKTTYPRVEKQALDGLEASPVRCYSLWLCPRLVYCQSCLKHSFKRSVDFCLRRDSVTDDKSWPIRLKSGFFSKPTGWDSLFVIRPLTSVVKCETSLVWD